MAAQTSGSQYKVVINGQILEIFLKVDIQLFSAGLNVGYEKIEPRMTSSFWPE